MFIFVFLWCLSVVVEMIFLDELFDGVFLLGIGRKFEELDIFGVIFIMIKVR